MRVDAMDGEKERLKQRYDQDRQTLWESLEKAHKKQFDLEKEVEQFRKDLERLNNQRNQLY